jgi:hypothetical protein
VKGKLVKAVTKPLRWITALLKRQPRTPGEAAFEAYMRENGIRFRYEVRELGKARRPDYTIRFGASVVKIDVKDLEEDSEVSTTIDQGKLSAIAVGDAEDDGSAMAIHVAGGAYDPHGKLRDKVNVARGQFREYKGSPCAMVLFTEGHGADLRSPEIMFGVMYGNYGISIPFNAERGDFVGTVPEYGFHSGGSVLHRKTPREKARIQNTTISALITLREVKIGAARLAEYVEARDEAAYTFEPALHARLKVDEAHFGVIVWENAFAATPLPPGLFRGPYDEYWSAKPEGGGNTRTHVGEKLQWTLDRYPDGLSPFEALARETPREGT